MSKCRLIERYEIHADKTFQVPLACLDVVWPNQDGMGFLVYRNAINIDHLVSSLREAIKSFPTFSGEIVYKDGEEIIAVGRSSLVLSVYTVNESFAKKVPFSSRYLDHLMDILEDEVAETDTVFRLSLLKSMVDDSCIFLWKTQHHHADGLSIWRFLRKIFETYNGLPNQDRECVERVEYISKIIEGIAPSNARYLGVADSGSDHSPEGIIEGESHSCLISVGEEIENYVDKNIGSRRSIINLLAIKTHAKCVNSDEFTLFKVIDARVKDLLPIAYSGNALLYDSRQIDVGLARSAPLATIKDYLIAQFSWDAEAARSAIAWLEQRKGKLMLENHWGSESFGEGESVVLDPYSGQSMIVNDLTHYPFSRMYFGQNRPIWYDSLPPTSANVITIMPVGVDEKAYVRVNGTEAYVNRFVQCFYENLGIGYC